MEEHSHLQQHQSYALESRVNSEEHVQTVAHAALKNIEGGTEAVNNYFDKGEQKNLFRLPRPKVQDAIRHLPFGQIY